MRQGPLSRSSACAGPSAFAGSTGATRTDVPAFATRVVYAGQEIHAVASGEGVHESCGEEPSYAQRILERAGAVGLETIARSGKFGNPKLVLFFRQVEDGEEYKLAYRVRTAS